MMMMTMMMMMMMTDNGESAVGVTQTYVESKVEGLEDQLRKLKTQMDDLTRTNGELVNTRNRLTAENSELQHQIRDMENNYGAYSKNRGQLQSQLDDAKSKLEEEIRVNNCRSLCLTLSSPVVPNGYTSKHPAPYWSNLPFLIFDIRALWRSGLSAREPECQKFKKWWVRPVWS